MTEAAFAEYLKSSVFDVDSHAEYVKRFVPREWQHPTGRGPSAARPACSS